MPKTETLAETYPAPRVAWTVTAILTFGYLVSFIDRQILNLLVTPIKADLGVSDTQMGLWSAWPSASSIPAWAWCWGGWPTP